MHDNIWRTLRGEQIVAKMSNLKASSLVKINWGREHRQPYKGRKLPDISYLYENEAYTVPVTILCAYHYLSVAAEAKQWKWTDPAILLQKKTQYKYEVIRHFTRLSSDSGFPESRSLYFLTCVHPRMIKWHVFCIRDVDTLNILTFFNKCSSTSHRWRCWNFSAIPTKQTPRWCYLYWTADMITK